MKPMAIALVAACFWLAAAPAGANDSTAELAAGGLVLRQSRNIEMQSEDLYISPTAVRVTYRFRNTSSAPISTVVAFPMPDITVAGPDENISVPNPDRTNFLNFATTVDGRPVTAQVELRVVARGVDRTAYLRSLGIPLSPYRRATGEALERLPAATRAQLIGMGLAMDEQYDVGQGMQHHMLPTWTLRTTYYWTQVFPPGRDLIVSHRYVPAVGGSAGTSLHSPEYLASADGRRQSTASCIDDDFLASVRRAAQRSGEGYPRMTEQRVGYVLTTGANWARPIGNFRMVIDKGSASNLVSFCGTGVRRISPTQFEVRYRNFTPRQDVSVLILVPTAP